jgi:uncharacterized LabA/DUF88 family protein
MKRAICYVDGLNLYHSISELRQPQLKWLDLWALAQSFLSAEERLQAVVYFTAVADWHPEKARRHRKYIAALRERGVEIVQSRFQRVTRSCRTQSRSCAFQEEKETDVALASRVLVDALAGSAEKQIVVTADTDHVPMFKHVRAAAPGIDLVLAVPPGRLNRSRALRAVACSYLDVHATRLRGCLLARNVVNAAGKTVAVCPADYFVA